MNNSKARFSLPMPVVAILVIACFILGNWAGPLLLSQENNNSPEENEPLYWVAPMDPNYRKDAPGKSPMGMDLIPVYHKADNSEEGAIQISPALQQNFSVQVEKAQPRLLKRQLTTYGVVQYDEDYLVHVHTRVEGWIEKLHINAVGDRVSKGQALFDIYSPTLVNAQEELILALQRKNTALTAAAKQKLRTLHVNEQVIKTLVATQKVQQTITRYASQAGVISHLTIREGYYVKPDKTLMAIAALDPIWIIADVMASDANNVFMGMKARLKAMSVGQSETSPTLNKQGVVEYIYPTLEPTSRLQKVRLRFENKDERLKPNMFHHIGLSIPDYSAGIAIPYRAVIFHGEKSFVVIKQKEQFKTVAVQLGQQDDVYVEVIKGLDVGDQVVVSSQFLIDSESSKTSDFNRWGRAEVKATHDAMNHSMSHSMNHLTDHSMHINHRDEPSKEIKETKEIKEQRAMTATVSGVIKAVEGNRVLIARGAIKKWSRPAATVWFTLEESQQAHASHLLEGAHLQFTFEVKRPDFVITDIIQLHPPKPSDAVGVTHD